jgi:hypothetical protein
VHKSVKIALSSLLTGVLSVGLAWAGASLTPTPKVPDVAETKATLGTPKKADNRSAKAAPVPDSNIAGPADFQPGAGQVLVGASEVSIEPKPEASKGEVWETEGCATMGGDASQETLMHAGDMRMRWPEKPGCIYSGGYGIGPMNPITSWDTEFGLAARSIALSDGNDTVVLTILDGASYFGDYNTMCDRCGAFEIAQQMGEELGIAPSGFMISSTHSHTSPDFIGGWGGVPQWYMDQVTRNIKDSMRLAVGRMRPALIEVGESLVRQHNSERRDFYRSAEDPFLSWFRALELKKNGAPTGKAIATVGAYGAHPVTVDWGEDAPAGQGNADFPAHFEKAVEQRFGGVGLYFMAGLGNMSPSGGERAEIGQGLAQSIPPIGSATKIQGNDVRSAQTFWDQPATNVPLSSLGVGGFFDRPFAQKPGQVTAGENANRPCRSASPVSVRTAVSVAKIGDLAITGGPGELFSNLTNSIKEERTNEVVLPLAQVNDGLGYIVQSFETDHAGRQGLGFVGDPLAEYEDAYSIDHCFGDMVLETTIGLLGSL